MPIKGLTDQEAAFPRIGMLRKGDPKPEQGNRPGKDLTYFRFTTDDKDAEKAFAAVYGEEPNDINVVLPYCTTDENFQSWREHWVKGGLKHRCDGETTVRLQLKDGTFTNEPHPCPGDCKPVGRLSVIIPELKRLASVTVQTTSLHDCMNLTKNLKMLEMQQGTLRGIPMVLSRRPHQVSTPGTNGKRVRREKWLLQIEAAPQYVALQLAAQQAAVMPQIAGAALPELEAPEEVNGVVVDADTGEILDTDPSGPDYDSDAFAVGEEVEPAPEPPPTNGNRPLSAESIRAACRQKANWFRDGDDWSRNVATEPITDKQTSAVVMLFRGAVPREDAELTNKARHDTLNYLFGVTSTKDLMLPEASAIIDWLTEPDCLDLNAHANAEAANVLDAIAVEAGQLELEMEAT